MRHLFTTKTIFFGSLLLFMALGCQQREPVDHQRFKTLMIKAEGELEALPNQAYFSVNLNCLKGNVKGAKECLVEKSNELQQQLLAFGIKKEDLLTTAVQLEKQYDWTSKGRVFKGYNSSTSVYVTVKDLDKLDEIYTELLENRNLDIFGLSYDHSQMEDLKNEAYIKALKNAKVLAEKLVAELPENNLDVLKIGNVELTASLPEAVGAQDAEYNLMEVQEDSRSRSIAINKGTVKVQATLYVEYQIK